MRWLTNFYDFKFKWTATAAIGILKPDCHSWWILKMQSGREDTLEERYAIEFRFQLGKKATETYGMLQTDFGPSCMNRASILKGIRDSRKAGSLWGMMRGVEGVRKSIHKTWLAKELGLGLLCWGFKGGGQHSSNRVSGISTRTIHQSTTPSLSQTIWPRRASRQFLTVPIVQTLAPCDFCLFSKLRGCRYVTIEEMKEAVTNVMDTLTQEEFHGALKKLLERYNKWIAAGGDYFEGDESFMCVLSIKQSGNLFNDPCIFCRTRLCLMHRHEFLISGPFVEVLLWFTLRIVPSILQGGQPRYLSPWWNFLYEESSSSSSRAGSTDIPDPLSPLLPIVHRPR